MFKIKKIQTLIGALAIAVASTALFSMHCSANESVQIGTAYITVNGESTNSSVAIYSNGQYEISCDIGPVHEIDTICLVVESNETCPLGEKDKTSLFVDSIQMNQVEVKNLMQGEIMQIWRSYYIYQPNEITGFKYIFSPAEFKSETNHFSVTFSLNNVYTSSNSTQPVATSTTAMANTSTDASNSHPFGNSKNTSPKTGDNEIYMLSGILFISSVSMLYINKRQRRKG